MRKSLLTIIGLALALQYTPAYAHFGAIIPSDDIVTQQESRDLQIAVKFIHPMEGHYMDMAKPRQFGVLHRGNKNDLLPALRQKKVGKFSTWETVYKIKRPGDYTFYLEPTPYWEPSEDCYIIHYTKVCVDALGLQEGWGNEVGFQTEIVPLTRPYGFWTGNVFTGIVKVKGKPVPYAEVEVEFLNESQAVKAPSDPYVTQVIKADANGVFSYAMPRAGWWGFAALNEASWKIKHKGEDKPVEIGAVYWVKTRDMK